MACIALQVNLHNDLPPSYPASTSGISIHWHGFSLHSPDHTAQWNDGFGYVQQCPIPIGSNFTYRFNVTEPPGARSRPVCTQQVTVWCNSCSLSSATVSLASDAWQTAQQAHMSTLCSCQAGCGDSCPLCRAGTYLWHDHSSALHGDGMLGALIVLPPEGVTPPGTPDYDEENTIVLLDWFHAQAPVQNFDFNRSLNTTHTAVVSKEEL